MVRTPIWDRTLGIPMVPGYPSRCPGIKTLTCSECSSSKAPPSPPPSLAYLARMEDVEFDDGLVYDPSHVWRDVEEFKILDWLPLKIAVVDWTPGDKKFYWGNINVLHKFKMTMAQLQGIDMNRNQSQVACCARGARDSKCQSSCVTGRLGCPLLTEWMGVSGSQRLQRGGAREGAGAEEA
eukprot:1668548-Rhodomonas_salina.1